MWRQPPRSLRFSVSNSNSLSTPLSLSSPRVFSCASFSAVPTVGAACWTPAAPASGVLEPSSELLSPRPGDRFANRYELVSEISRSLKMLAKELHLPVLAIAQLSRGSERRPDKRPQLSDLRDSGALEQDANTVLLLHRPDRYDEHAQPGLTEVIVAKAGVPQKMGTRGRF